MSLEQIDIIRERTGVTYKQAQEALNQADGNVVEAIIWLEEQQMQRGQWTEYAAVKGSQLLEQIKQLVQEGNIRRVRILQGNRVVLEFPVTAGAVGALLAPHLAAVGAVAALLTHCTIEVEKVAEPDDGDADAPATPEGE